MKNFLILKLRIERRFCDFYSITITMTSSSIDIQEVFHKFDVGFRDMIDFAVQNPNWIKDPDIERVRREYVSLIELNRWLRDLLLNNTNVRVVVPESTLLQIVVEFMDSSGETKRDCINNDVPDYRYYTSVRILLIEAYGIPGFEELPDA